MDRTVFVARCPAYTPADCDAAVERVFAALPAAGRIGPKTRILCKPNLLARHPPERAVTTHPEILRAVLAACLRRGAKPENITVADSSGGLYNPGQMKALYKTSGLWQVCEELGVRAYTDCESAAVPVKNGHLVREFTLIRPALEADFIIDLPKFKTHVMTGMTAAVKNLFGLIPGLQKAEWHTRFPDRERFGEMLIDLLETVRPDMALLDGVTGMEGDGPSGGEARNIGLVMGSEDLSGLDLAVCHMMGLDPMRVPYLFAAHARGLCGERFDPAALRGDTELAQPLPGWKLPGSFAKGGAGSTDFAVTRKMPEALRPAAQWVEAQIAPHPVIEKSRCIGCGRCKEICPQHTIVLQNGKARIRPQNCIRCFCCHEMCPVKAIAVKKLGLFRL